MGARALPFEWEKPGTTIIPPDIPSNSIKSKRNKTTSMVNTDTVTTSTYDIKTLRCPSDLISWQLQIYCYATKNNLWNLITGDEPVRPLLHREDYYSSVTGPDGFRRFESRIEAVDLDGAKLSYEMDLACWRAQRERALAATRLLRETVESCVAKRIHPRRSPKSAFEIVKAFYGTLRANREAEECRRWDEEPAKRKQETC